MSEKLPAVRGAALLRALQRAGFAETRVRGSHHFMRHPDGRATTVPVHGSRELPKGLVAAILSKVGLTSDDLRGLL